MRPAGRLVTIKRSGEDGAHFPLSLSTCLFGRGTECDIRIQLPVVSKQHCKIEIKEQKAILCNFSSTNPTQVNGSAIEEPVPLKHGDIITIIDRSFRYENESRQNGRKAAECPGSTHEQDPARRTLRAGFSADSDGKEQDSKAHSKVMEGNARGRPLEHAKKFMGDTSSFDGPKDSTAQEPPRTSASEHQGHSGRKAGDLLSGDCNEKSRVTLGSCYGELRSFSSTLCFDKSKKNESPFKKLYLSMKEELDAKSQGQNIPQYRRKSGSQTDRTTGKDGAGGLQREPQLPLSCKSRRKSGRGTPMKADPEEKGSVLEPVEASWRLASPSIALSETPRVRAPVWGPQQPGSSREHGEEDLRGTRARESLTLGGSPGIKAFSKIVTPGKLLARNQAPAKAEDATSPGEKSEYLPSRSRSALTDMDVLPAESQGQPFIAQCLTQVERRIHKDSLNKPGKWGTAAGQMCSGLPHLCSVDISNFGDSSSKNEDLSLKRRRVSFGGRLRPELFDENLPPNTPLKRGETPAKRRSLAAPSPAVLKKIIKEQPTSPGMESSSEVCWKVKAQSVFAGSPTAGPRITSPGPDDQRRRSGKASIASGGSKSPQDTPKKAGRRSGHLSSKRASISRSQHGILQMICSRRRSGASEANLIVAKSWADVVKLGAKQTQAKVVKHGPQRQISRRQRRPSTGKKPPASAHSQGSTGHANSPCTIVIGKAQIEKVSVPARPYRMLNNLVFNQKMDYKEDLSGLTEMFKTPVKEKLPVMTTSSSTLFNSENLLGKKSEVTNSGGKPLPVSLEILGENVFSSTQKAAKESSDTGFASPSLRRRSIREEEYTVKTPRSLSKMTPLENIAPGSSADPPRVASSAKKLRRSTDLRNAEVPGAESKSEAEADVAEAVTGGCLRGTPQRAQGEGREAKGGERPSETREENTESKGKLGKMTAVRRSRTGGQKCDPTASLTEETLEIVPRRDPSGSQVLPQISACTGETMNEEERAANMPCSSPRTGGKRRHKRPLGQVDVQDEGSSLRKVLQEATHTPVAPGDNRSTGVCKGTQKQNEDPVGYGTGNKKGPRTPKKKTQATLEDLGGFKELFQTPKHIEESKTVDKMKVLGRSPRPERVGTPTSSKTRPNTLQGKVDLKPELPTPQKLRRTSEEGTHTPQVPGGEGRAIKAFQKSPRQVLDPAVNVATSKRQRGAPKEKAQPLEDLAGIQELFQTPGHGRDPKTVVKTTGTSCRSAGLESGDTPAPPKRRSRTTLQKVEVREALSALGELTQSLERTMHTPTMLVQKRGVEAFMETPRQKLELTENVTGRKRQLRAPKEKAQPLEDLAGIQELFQTPGHGRDPKTVVKTTGTPCRSAGPESGDTPAPPKRRSRTTLETVQVREALSALGELAQSLERTMHTPTMLVQKRGVEAFMETPRQKLELTENVSGRKRQPRAPKEKAQPLEDLAGIRELFQTPHHGQKPETAGQTAEMLCQSPRPEPVRTPASTKRRSRSSVRKVDAEEELSALWKLSDSSGKAMLSPMVAAQEEKGTRAFMGTPKPKLDTAENSTGLKRQPRAPKEKALFLEDLAGIRELFQTPGRGRDPEADGDSGKVLYKSTGPEPVRTPASTKRRSRKSLQTVEVKEEVSALNKPTQMLGEAMHIPGVPGVEGRAIKAFQKSPQQALDSAANVAASKRQRGAPKEKAQPLEDLAGIQELFQTPGHGRDPKTVVKTTSTPCRSVGPESGDTPAPPKRRSRTTLQKVEVREALSALGELAQSLERTMHTPTMLVQKRGVEAFMETPKQKLELTENVSGRKRQPRAPKEKAQPLEDLAGIRELFQTPHHGQKPETAGQTAEMLCQFPRPEPVRTPASTKRRSRSSVRKVDAEEELSALWKLSDSSGKAMLSPMVAAQEEKGTRAFMGTPKPKLDTAENSTGLKRQPRAPKEKALFLEDLAGIRELFQTPGHGRDPEAGGDSGKMLYKSTGPEPVRTPASTKRRSTTSLQTVEVREALSALGELTQSLERTMHTPTMLVQKRGVEAFMETPKQKQELAENVTGRKRQPRAPKEKSQPLEDLAGIQELFQTPGHGRDPKTVVKTTGTPCRSVGPESGDTPAPPKRRSRTTLETVQVREALSALGELAQSLERTMHTPTMLVQKRGVEAFMETPRQKLELTENVSGRKRQPRAPKEKAQPLEDLAGIRELFQTPHHGQKAETAGQTAEMLCQSPRPEPVRTPASTKRRSRSSVRKVDAEEELSALWKLSDSSGKAMLSPMVAAQEEKGTRAFMGTPKPKLDTAENSTGLKRQPRAPKEKALFLEDLAGIRELFQTPGHGRDPEAGGDSGKVLYKSTGPEPVRTPASRKRRSTTSLGKAVRKLTQTSGEATNAVEESIGDDKGVKMFKKPAKRKLDPVENVTGRKRRRGAPEGKAQSLEDLAGFQELFQVPVHPEEHTRDEKTTGVTCRSPQPEAMDSPVSTQRQLRSRLRTVQVKEELPAADKPTWTSRTTRHSSKAPGGGDKGGKALKALAQQTLFPAASATGSRQLRAAPKGKAQSLEDLADSKEPAQAPGHAEGSVHDEKPTNILCKSKSPQPGPVEAPARSESQLRTRLRKAPATAELSAQGKVTRAPPRHTHKEPEVDTEIIQVANVPVKRRLDSAASAPGSKRHRGAPEGKVQPLEDLAGFQELIQVPGHTQEPTSDEKTTGVPWGSPQPEAVDSPASTQRQLRSRLRTVQVKEELPATTKPTRTTRATRHSSKAPVYDADSKALEESSQQTLVPAASAASSRQLRRAPKDKAQPLKDLAGSKEPAQVPGHTEGLRNDGHSLKSTLITGGRVLRARKEKPVEGTGDTRDPATSQSKSSSSMPLRSKSGKGGLVSGLGGQHSETASGEEVCPQDTVQVKKSVHSKQRAAPSGGGKSEPLLMKKGLKVLINRIESVEEQNSIMKTEKQEPEDSAPAIMRASLCARHQNKTEGEQQRPSFTKSAEKIAVKRNEKKPTKTSQGMEPGTAGDGDGKPASRGQVREKRVCLRSGRQNKTSQPHTAEEPVREGRLVIPTKDQEEKGAAGIAASMCLRTRKPSLQPRQANGSEQRGADSLKKQDKDTVCTKKTRSRSHRNS